MTFADRAINYFSKLKTPNVNFDDVQILNPFQNLDVIESVKMFYKKFYDDNNERIYVFGINYGRFGGGLTGISFTDPVALEKLCGIENNFGHIRELSSKFIYQVIENYGGVKKFFSKIYLTALLPFAILKSEKNYNYYDNKSLSESLKIEIVNSIKSQIKFGARKDSVIILGKKNAYYFLELNKQLQIFNKVVILDHPRYVMQYK
ncbi:MAG: DUF4918 family protein, partial [Ignavibacterium sp.]|nr:DUF4918 family protein [Ignavibacterium sp.]MDW8374198.1 DUF4918 family protein [Ignavibacteriales bacterium]